SSLSTNQRVILYKRDETVARRNRGLPRQKILQMSRNPDPTRRRIFFVQAYRPISNSHVTSCPAPLQGAPDLFYRQIGLKASALPVFQIFIDAYPLERILGSDRMTDQVLHIGLLQISFLFVIEGSRSRFFHQDFLRLDQVPLALPVVGILPGAIDQSIIPLVAPAAEVEGVLGVPHLEEGHRIIVIPGPADEGEVKFSLLLHFKFLFLGKGMDPDFGAEVCLQLLLQDEGYPFPVI